MKFIIPEEHFDMSIYFNKIEKFLPEASHSYVKELLNYKHKKQYLLEILPKRKTFTGQWQISNNVVKIKLCETENKFDFLITFIHELAHHLQYENYRMNGKNVKPHGVEKLYNKM